MPAQLIYILIRFILYAMGLALIIWQWRVRPDRWERALAWSVVLVHGMVYAAVYTVDYLIGGAVNGLFYNEWSRILWMNFMIVFVAVEAVRLWHLRTRGIDGC